MIIKNYNVLLSVAFLHYFFSILVKFENILFYSDTKSIDFRALICLFACSWPDIAFSLCLGVVYKICMDATPRRFYSLISKIAFAVVTCINLYLLVNQVYYKVTFTNMKLSAVATEQSINARKAWIVFGSFLGEIDSIFYINVLLLIACTYSVALTVLKIPRLISKDHTEDEINAAHNTKHITITKKYFIVWSTILTIIQIGGICNLNRSSDNTASYGGDVALDHPITIFMYDYFSSNPKHSIDIDNIHNVNNNTMGSRSNFHKYFVIKKNDNDGNNSMKNTEKQQSDNNGGQDTLSMKFIYKAIKGKLDRNAINKENKEINEYFENENIQKLLKKKPHIFIYTLESIGSKNLFPSVEGYANIDITPNIASLQKNGITFSNVYDTFPSTTRTHIPLQTGGIIPTMGSIEEQNRKYYTGETLTRYIKKIGYETALFAASDLRFEGLDQFYEQFHYDKFHHYGNADDKFRSKSYLNSWGGTDHDMIDEALKYLDKRDRISDDKGIIEQRPLFMHLLPDATHHPYTTPSKFLNKYGKYVSNDRYENYQTALRYTDECIGILIDGLKERNMWNNSVVILVGDHGEAFGQSHKNHPKNFLHKNFLYSENIMTFFIFSHSSVLSKSSNIVSKRLASVGDFFPSTIGFLNKLNGAIRDDDGIQNINIPGQNLFSVNYELQLQFFHKSSDPYQWGCRDGNFKIISNQLSDHVEIYDLLKDPGEKINIAKKRLGMKSVIDMYERRIQAWYVSVHCWYVLQLKDYAINSHCDEMSISNYINANSMKHPGPKRGFIGLGHSASTFRKITTVDPYQKEFTIYIEWLAYLKNTAVIFDFAPIALTDRSRVPLARGIVNRLLNNANDNGAITIEDNKSEKSYRYCQIWHVQKGWHTAWYFFKKMKEEKKVGIWNMIIWDETDGFKTPKLMFNVNVTHKKKT